jgi:arabinan endo-1,5-alpha-L-arabinosidase
MLSLMLAGSAAFAQQSIPQTFTSTDWGARYGNITAVDVDNDGYRDLILAGIGSNKNNYAGSAAYEQNRMSHVVKFNSSTKGWTVPGFVSVNDFDAGIGFNVTDRPSISVCDINQDGIMDVVVFEATGQNYNDECYLDHISQEGVYLGNGDGSFSKATLSFVDQSGNAVNFDLRTILSADVADFNNDGLVDIVGIGYQVNPNYTVKTYPEANVVLLNQGGGKFMVSHFFTDDYVSSYGQDGKAYHLNMGSVKAYDFNNDGYTDFFVSAESQDRSTLGTSYGVSSHFSDIFLNDPAHPGQFRRQNLHKATTPLPYMGEGGIAVADYNDDGVPDIFFSGWTGNGRNAYVYKLFTGTINSDGTVAYTDKGNSGIAEMRNQNTTNSQYGAFDWNGDGEFDIVNMGWSTSLSTQTCFISTGNGAGAFTNAYRTAGGSEGSIAIADWDGNGVNDLVSISRTDDDTYFTTDGLTQVVIATENPSAAPAKPDAPTLSASAVSAGKVTLAWTDAASSKKNVTYEYYIKNSEGKIVAGGNAFTDGDNAGTRKVSQPGNAFNARSVTVALPDGSYTYGVQTVNAALQGSAFTTGSFTVSGSSATALTAEMPKVTEAKVNTRGDSYQNPVINMGCADPSVVRTPDGDFYAYATNSPIYHSTDMVNWDLVRNSAFSMTPTWLSGGAIWAPDCNYVNGWYLYYYTLSKWGEEHANGIGVAVSKTPGGPFSNLRKLFTSDEIGVQNSIDQFYIEEGDSKYLFWGSFRGIYGLQLSDNGRELATNYTKTQIAGTLTEGTYIIKHDGYFYLVGSAGSCCDGANSTYHLVVARSQNLFGPYVNKLGEKALDNKFSNLLYRSSAVIGPGHNAEWMEDDEGNYWMLYHGWKASDTDAGRVAYLDRVYWDEDGWPYFKNARPSVSSPSPVFTATSGINNLNASEATGDATVVIPQKRVHNSLDILKTDGAHFSYTLCDLDGKKLKAGKAVGKATVDLYDVAWGMYIITVKSGSGKHTEKIIKY